MSNVFAITAKKAEIAQDTQKLNAAKSSNNKAEISIWQAELAKDTVELFLLKSNKTLFERVISG